MGLCAGLGILLLQPEESWQGVQALASTRVMWLTGCWLLAGILGWGCSWLCLPHGCLLAVWWVLAAHGEGSRRSPAGTGVLAEPGQCGTSCSACLAQGQPLWHVPSQKRVPPASVSMLGGTVCQARCPGKVCPLQMGGRVSWKLLAWQSEHMHKHKMY